MDEAAAIHRLRNGDIGGLEVLVQHYQVRAVRAAFLVCGDQALAEDIVQAAFLRAFDRIHQFDSRLPFRPWFFRMVINATHTAVARAERTIPLEWNDWDQALSHIDPDPALEDRLIAAETRTLLAQALAQLPPAQRAAIVLRYYLGLSEAEMAAQLECAPGTVKWRLSVARQRLRALLLPWLGSDPQL